MTVKKKYLVGIMDDSKIHKVNNILVEHATMTAEYNSYMIFSKQPVDLEHTASDVTMFQLICEDETTLNKKLKVIIDELNKLNTDYILVNETTRKLIVKLDYVGKLFIKFDNIKIIQKGTFDRINKLKIIKTDYGYCKGFKPEFRPIEGQSIENIEVKDEIIYLISDSNENLSKLKEYISQKVLEINSDFIIDYEVFEENINF